MATILVFRSEGRAADGDSSFRSGLGVRPLAEIIIFPGVRYERATDREASISPARQAAATERDRLELIE